MTSTILIVLADGNFVSVPGDGCRQPSDGWLIVELGDEDVGKIRPGRWDGWVRNGKPVVDDGGLLKPQVDAVGTKVTVLGGEGDGDEEYDGVEW